MIGCPLFQSTDALNEILTGLFHLAVFLMAFVTAVFLIFLLEDKPWWIRWSCALLVPVVLPILPAIPLVLLIGKWGYVIGQLLVFGLIHHYEKRKQRREWEVADQARARNQREWEERWKAMEDAEKTANLARRQLGL